MMKLWKLIGPWLRVVLCIGLLTFLFYQIDIRAILNASLNAMNHWPWLVSGIAMTFLGLAAGAMRWSEILAAQGIRFSPLKVVHIFLVGQFFNAFMLGACGGDIVRAYYAAKYTGS